MSNYDLKQIPKDERGYTSRVLSAIKEIGSYLNGKKLIFATLLTVLSSAAQIVIPYLLGTAIDKYIKPGDIAGLVHLIFYLFGLYIVTAVILYFQQVIMGNETQSALFRLRGRIFEKIQELPTAFFNQNKVGDLMSRINNDTEKLSQFLSESILRFVGSAMTLVGIAFFVLYINIRLGSVLLISILVLFIITRFVSPVIERASKTSSKAVGEFTSGVQENLTNFKAIVAFDRRNYFEENLTKLSNNAYKSSLTAGFASKILEPIFDFGGYVAQTSVLVYGLYLVTTGNLTIGLLIAFITYAVRFYSPLQYMATIFGEMQKTLASWSRVKDILDLKSDMNQEGVESEKTSQSLPNSMLVLEFKHVSFGYDDDQVILKDVCMKLEPGKTYALVGPTGGGKSTTASLMARLYDPTSGEIDLLGKPYKSYSAIERSEFVSLILQEPQLFEGTVADNIRYGNDHIVKLEDEVMLKMFESKGMNQLIARFQDGLQTKVDSGGENISLGQKQLVSFLRIILREPKLLILDEATANIDTVTESLLQTMIDSLPKETTKVIIAHRLNTIQKADQIFFINAGNVEPAKSLKEATDLIQNAKRVS